ncbi:MAG: hypothetical protein ACRCXZ_00830 [Patescibacteria group bacterium]
MKEIKENIELTTEPKTEETKKPRKRSIESYKHRSKVTKTRGKKTKQELFKLNAELTREQGDKLKFLAEENKQSVSKTIRDLLDLFPEGQNLMSVRRQKAIKEFLAGLAKYKKGGDEGEK